MLGPTGPSLSYLRASVVQSLSKFPFFQDPTTCSLREQCRDPLANPGIFKIPT